jgi:hypothetical protein
MSHTTTTSKPIDPTQAVEPICTLSEFLDQLEPISPDRLEPISSDQLEPISPASIRLDRKMCWGEWSKLSKVSLQLKEHIITTPFFATRLDLHCVDCILCHVCFGNLPDYMSRSSTIGRRAKGCPKTRMLESGVPDDIACPVKNVQLPTKRYWAIVMARSITKGGNVEL